ncbi:sulfatase-like hydrolase/transferase [Bacteroides thetaiotaomicron]|nr:sulfatase-like hydrolase/transferase [Bacteroides thetaiotaomicron]
MNIKKHLPWLGALLPIINAQADTNPNVVIIYIDDMGIGDIGCYGGKFVATPNIDKLAQDGLLFNQYYSSAPVSSPLPLWINNRTFPY